MSTKGQNKSFNRRKLRKAKHSEVYRDAMLGKCVRRVWGAGKVK